MGTHNAVTLLKKSDAVLGMMVRHFSQSAFDDGVPLDQAVRTEIVQLQADIKAQVKHIEKTGQLEQPPHPKGKDRAEKTNAGRQSDATRKEGFRTHKKGFGKGGGMSHEELVKMRAERVERDRAGAEEPDQEVII